VGRLTGGWGLGLPVEVGLGLGDRFDLASGWGFDEGFWGVFGVDRAAGSGSEMGAVGDSGLADAFGVEGGRCRTS